VDGPRRAGADRDRQRRLERVPLETPWTALDSEVRRRLSACCAPTTGGTRWTAAERRRSAGAGVSLPRLPRRPGARSSRPPRWRCSTATTCCSRRPPASARRSPRSTRPCARARPRQTVFVLTAKTLQQDMAMKVSTLLNGDGAFHAMRLRAKAKMCANGEVICHEEYCAFARDYYGKLKLARRGAAPARRGATARARAIFRRAHADEVCPFEISLDLAHQVQVVVCDYNYAFDPYVSLSDFGAEGDLSDTILVIDEIHNLVERGRGYYSPALSAAGGARGRPRRWRATATRPSASCVRVCRGPRAARRRHGLRAAACPTPPRAPAGGRDAAARGGAVAAAAAVRRRLRRLPRVAAETNRAFRPDDPFVDALLRRAAVPQRAAGVEHAAFDAALCAATATCSSRSCARTPAASSARSSTAPTRRSACRRRCRRPSSTATSWASPTGRTAALSLPDPFPATNRRIVVDATVETTYKQRPFHYARIAERLPASPRRCPATSWRCSQLRLPVRGGRAARGDRQAGLRPAAHRQRPERGRRCSRP
jgi:hypothetical protein